MKDIKNHDEYTCNLHNSNLFICEGQTSFLADAFYNGKFSLIMTNYNDIECVINSVVSERFGYSKMIYEDSKDIDEYFSESVTVNYNENIKLLHERIDLL